MTMHTAHKEFLEERFAAKKWHGRSDSGRRTVKEFYFAGSELKGWKLIGVKGTEEGSSKVLRSMWSRGENINELLSVDVFVSASVKGAHDMLLEALGNMQSGAIERITEKNTPGDVAFHLANTMITFARANLVVVIRNAGRTIVPVGTVARDLDTQIQGKLESA
jgi:hypothetical protein